MQRWNSSGFSMSKEKSIVLEMENKFKNLLTVSQDSLFSLSMGSTSSGNWGIKWHLKTPWKSSFDWWSVWWSPVLFLPFKWTGNNCSSKGAISSRACTVQGTKAESSDHRSWTCGNVNCCWASWSGPRGVSSLLLVLWPYDLVPWMCKSVLLFTGGYIWFKDIHWWQSGFFCR